MTKGFLTYTTITITMFAMTVLCQQEDAIVPETDFRASMHILQGSSTAKSLHTVTLKLTKQNVHKEGEMRCHAFEWFQDQTADLKGWQAKPTVPEHIHHMSLFACPELGQGHITGKTWSCDMKPPCGDDKYHPEMIAGFEHMIPGSAINIKRFVLPPKVSYQVGLNTNRKYGVIAVHNNAPIPHDESGFKLFFEPRSAQAAIPSLQAFVKTWDLTTSAKSIPPAHRNFRLPGKMVVRQNKYSIWGLHLHYHSFGKRIQVRVLRKDGTTQLLAQRIGDAHSNKIFKHPVVVHPGDKVTAFCQYDTSKASKPVLFGMDPFKNEMCNVFIMGYAEDSQKKLKKYPDLGNGSIV